MSGGDEVTVGAAARWPSPIQIALAFALASAGLALAEVGLLRLGSLYLAADLTHAQLGLALFGLAIGAAWAARTRAARPQLVPAALALTAALTGLAAWTLPRSDVAWALGVGAWPFASFGFASGVAWSGPWDALQRRRLYGAELLGAIGGIAVVAPLVVGWAGGAGLLAVGAVVSGAAAALLAGAWTRPDRAARLRPWIAWLALGGLLAAGTDEPLPASVGVQRHLDAAVAADGLVAMTTRHGIWARTDLVQTHDEDALLLYTDAMTVARAPRWDGRARGFASATLQTQATLRRVALGRCGAVLVVGAGAGFDVAVALQQGASSVVAIEVNPDLLALARAADPAYTAAFRRDEVRWIAGDGRRVAASLAGPFDCILLGLVETAPASLRRAGRVDGRLLTVEAMQTWRRLLASDGHLAVLHNEDELGARSAATAAVAFGADAVRAFALPATPADNPARVLVVASPSATRRDALAASARAAGAGVATVATSEAIHDHRPALRPGNPAPLAVLALALAAIAAAAAAAASRRLRITRGAGAAAARASWIAALLAGFGGAALQMVAIERATAAVGSPALAQPVALAAALAGAALGGAWLSAATTRTAVRGVGWALAALAALALGAGGDALVGAVLSWPTWLAAAALGLATLVAAMATGAAWIAAIESVDAAARPVVLAWDGVGALLAAGAAALGAAFGGLAWIGASALIALVGAALAARRPDATVGAEPRSAESPEVM